MTSERDFDRIARAWLDQGPEEAPDRAIAAVLLAVDSTPQVRRPFRWPLWRPDPMTRLPLLAALAGVVIIAIGALTLSGGGPAPAPTTVSPSPTTSAAASSSPGPVPAAVKGGWTAASRGTALEDPDITTIVLGGSAMDQFAPEFSIDRPGFTRILGSNVVEESPGVLRITLSTPGNSGCATRDQGTYGWRASADGQWLTLELVEDACKARSDIVAGTWQRNLAFRNLGGPGIATNFMPYMSLTLPEIPWTGTEYANVDTFVAERENRTFKVWKDLDGFFDPCDLEKGRLLIDPGLDAFLAYLNGDARFTVVRQHEFTMDGQRAVEVELRIGENLTAPCWTLDGNADDRTGVLTWVPQAGTTGGFWNDTIGGRDILVVTEVDGVTLTFEALTFRGEDLELDRATLDTVRFLDALPTPPGS